MRRTLLAVPLVLAALFAGAWLSLGADRLDGVADRVDRSVVRVFVLGPQGLTSGTGFVVSPGVIATNFHVVVRAHRESSWSVVVADRVADKEFRRPAKILEVFPGEDLALLQVEELDRPPVAFAKPHGHAKGYEIFAIGFPGAADRLGPADEASVVRGAVSRTFAAPWEEGAPTIEIIQHTAPTNPGNSGGPLVDGCGHVVGVNSQREARVVFGPGGIPLVSDPIQGVFYASSAEVLTEKLKALGIAYDEARGRCGAGLTGALGDRRDSVLVIAAILLSIAGLGLLLRRRAVVQVVVYCSEMIATCVHAIERVVEDIHAKRRDRRKISVTVRGPASENGPKTEVPPAPSAKV